MPTGYTAPIKDDISFKEYALLCARAFGALIDMKEDPLDAPIPDSFEACVYHKEKIQQDRARLIDIQNMSAEDREIAAAAEYKEQEDIRLLRLRESQELQQKYEAMLAQVEKYKSPSPDHDKFKEFMRNQILDSIPFDCNKEYYSKPTPKMSGSRWANKRIQELRSSIEYHKKEYEKELERTLAKNSWIRLLKESLK